MANVFIAAEGRRIEQPQEVAAFLKPFGILYEHWPLEGRVGEDAGDAEILQAYAPEIERLKREGGYITADVINVTPQTPGLDELLERFNKEHRHTDDEVRFTVRGRGVFHINPDQHPVFAIEVGPGDLINVPAGTRHWFDLCAERTIRTIRLFLDPAGWTPHYLPAGVHGDYTAMCWGPQYFVPASDTGVGR